MAQPRPMRMSRLVPSQKTGGESISVKSTSGRQLFMDAEPRERAENSNPNVGEKALGNLVSSRLHQLGRDEETTASPAEDQMTVAARITYLEKKSAGNTPNASPTKKPEKRHEYETFNEVPCTGPPMLQGYLGPPVTPPMKKPETEPNLTSMQATVAPFPRTEEEKKDLKNLQEEAFINAGEATRADQAGSYSKALELYILVAYQLMQVISRDPALSEKIVETIQNILGRIEELQKALATKTIEEVESESLAREYTPESPAREYAPDSMQNLPVEPAPTVAQTLPPVASRPVQDEGDVTDFAALRHKTGSVGSGMRSHTLSSSTTQSLSKEQAQKQYHLVMQFIGKVVTGGDVSGQGQGYSKAFIMSQQITNLNAGTTGELKRLAPLSKEYEDRWRTEMRLYLQLAESMSVKVPQTKKGSNGQSIQVMVDKQRQDIAENLPILKSCDERLHAVLRSFTDLDGEVEYKTKRDDGQPSSKWWIDQPFVLNCGLSRKLHTKMRKSYEDLMAIYKSCQRINSKILGDMKVPPTFINQQPPKARDVIGHELVKALTKTPNFRIDEYLRNRGVWNEIDAQACASRLERVCLIWKRNLQEAKSRKLWMMREWKAKISAGLESAEIATQTIRNAFPSMEHTKLDEAKLQNNLDLGKAILEAYSRALESRSARVMSRVKAILDADEVARKEAVLAKSRTS